MNKLAVIGANAPLLSFYRQAKQLGYHLVGIAWEEGAVCKPYCDRFYPISFAERDEVLRVCQQEQIDGITSFSLESALPTVVFVAQHLGLVSNGYECVELTATKYSQRRAFETAGIPVPRYVKVSDADALRGCGLRYPVIVKPVDGGGSQGINKVDAPDGAADAVRGAAKLSRSGEAIVEEFVDGREFSVEYLSHRGSHYCLQITDKVTSGTPRFIEIQHHQPADIPWAIARRIQSVVERGLTALKIENSPSHSEIKLTPQGELRIIEVGARMGGGHITSDLVKLSTGYDMVRGTIELALGRFQVPTFPSPMYAGVRFYSSLDLAAGDIIRHHERYPAIVEWQIEEGVPAEARSNADRSGYYLYRSADGRFNPR